MTTDPGWYQDPAAAHQLRWWTGQMWTQETRPRPPDPVPVPAGAKQAEDLWLPRQMVEYSYLPGVCVRHGRPAVRMQRAPVYSPTPIWVIPFIFIGLLIGLLVALAVRTTVWGAWPVCEVCEARRRQHRNAMLGCLAASVLSIVAAIGLHSGSWVLLVVLLIPAAIVFGALSSWNRVTSSIVDSKLGAVHVKSTSAAFAAAVRGAPMVPAAMSYATRGW